MTALLVLLGLLSAATLVNRRGNTEIFLHLASAPLFVGLGVLLSPSGLGFLLPSTAQALMPALRVAVGLLGMLVGLRTRPPTEANFFAHGVWTTALVILTWLVMAGAVLGTLWALDAVGLLAAMKLGATSPTTLAL